MPVYGAGGKALKPGTFSAAGYDLMQVCLNGHKITEYANTQPQHCSPYCQKCGEKTITSCPECHTEILGHYHSGGFPSAAEADVPNNCRGCSAAYPWRQAAIASAIEVLQMDLDAQDAAAVPDLVRDISVDVPRTQIAALKLKKLMPKLGTAAYDVAIKVISDVASETAKKILGLGPGRTG